MAEERIYPIRFRRGYAAEWTSKNPVLAPGEPGYEVDTGQFKVGNGSTLWNDLAYFQVTSADEFDFEALLENHVLDATPHPVYDDGPSLALLYENKKV